MMQNPFRTFWMAGYECSDKINVHGVRVDLLSETQHTALLEEDYDRLSLLGVKTVREGIRWSQVEKAPYEYDWSVVKKMILTGKQYHIQQVWDLCHFGFPDDLTPFHPTFSKRFAALCRSFADLHSTYSDEQLIVTPINEVSFLSWLGGEAGATVPYCTNSGWKVKYALMKAYIAGVAALKERDPQIIILSTEPLVNIVAPLGASDEEIFNAREANEDQFQSTDMLTGRICPELGGKPEYLDVIGLNYYYSNQFECGTGVPLPWVNTAQDPRWLRLRDLLTSAYQRYHIPLIIAETSHPGEHRANWLTSVTEECVAVLQQQIPLWGVCLYPILNRPDWDDLNFWHESGLWELAHEETLRYRVLNKTYAAAFQTCRQMITGMRQPCSQRLEMSGHF